MAFLRFCKSGGGAPFSKFFKMIIFQLVFKNRRSLRTAFPVKKKINRSSSFLPGGGVPFYPSFLPYSEKEEEGEREGKEEEE